MAQIILPSILRGFLAGVLLLIFYFAIVTLISGWDFAQNQFLRYWYFILSLATGFGIQVALYFYLRDARSQKVSSKALATSGTTSAVAMVSCCSHYLVNILPVVGISGFVALIAQYQLKLFWIGLVVNIVSILYLTSRVVIVAKE